MVVTTSKKEAEKKVEEEIKTEDLQDLDDFEMITEDDEPKLGRNKSITEEDIQIVNDLMGEFDVNILHEAEKEIEELMKDLDLENERSEIPNSFAKVKLENFPLFLTIKEFFYLMDSLMPESFFSRNLENIIKAGIKKDNGKRGFYRYKQNQSTNRLLEGIIFRETDDKKIEAPEISSDEDDLPIESPAAVVEEDIPRSIDINASNNIDSTDLVTEVEFEDFRDLFFPYFLEKKKAKRMEFQEVTPTMAWTQIRNLSTDGSRNWESFTKSKDESEEEKNKRINAKCGHINREYNDWKTRSGNYDLNDIYNHIYKFYDNDVVANNLIDFLFLDEIQDIPLHILSYMRRFGTKYFYFSGDNAQNITKGVSFKFKELAETYNSYKRASLSTEFHPLTINFRSHQKILDLGNNLVNHLRMFFPAQIEFLPPEESTTDGPKPIIIPLGEKPENLISFMKKNMGVTGEGSDLTFKSGQVFITRDYTSKQKILEAYKSAIAFTILEAKGMEFDDVILYNYFSDSENHAPFLVFSQCLEITRKDVEKFVPPEFGVGRICYCKKNQLNDSWIQYVIENDKEKYARLTEKMLKNGVSEASDELKFLYVAVTRARSRIVIYDEIINVDASKHKRGYFDSVWQSLDLVSFSNNEGEVLEFNLFSKADKSKERSKWIKEGFEYMQRGLYDYADICFTSGEFQKGVSLARLCRQAIQLKRDYYLLLAVTSNVESEMIEMQEKKLAYKEELYQVAEKFKGFEVYHQAAQCFSMINEFLRAAEVYEMMGDFSKAADYYVEIKQYEKAFSLYKKSGDIMGMINSLQFENDPESVLALVDVIKSKLNAQDFAKVNLIAKRSLRQLVAELNDNLLEDKPVNFGVIKDFTGMKQSNQNEEMIEEEPVLAKSISADPEIKDSFCEIRVEENIEKKEEASARAISEDDIVSNNSFDVINLDEVLSDKGNSFEYIKSEIDDLEKLSESFVELTVQNQQIRTNPSTVFEDLSIKHDHGFNFRENQILTKLVGLCMQYKDLFMSKSEITDLENEVDEIAEIGAVDIPEKCARNIFEFVEETGAYTMRMLLERKLGYQFESISLLTSYLYMTSQIPVNYLNYEGLMFTLKNKHFENRRLSTISFLTNLQKFDVNLLKTSIRERYMQSRAGLAQIVALGYFRQTFNLLPLDKSIPILVAYGEVQTLFMIKSANNEKIFDREYLINSLVTVGGVRKLLIIYENFKDDEDMIESSLFYFCTNYLFKPETYSDKEDVQQAINSFKNIREPIYDLLHIFFLAAHANTHDQRAELFRAIMEIPVVPLSRKNSLEAGVLLGALFQLLMNKNELIQNYTAEGFKDCQFQVNQLKTLVRAYNLFHPKIYRTIRGFLMSYKVSILSPTLGSMIVVSSHGALVSKTSPIIEYIQKLSQRANKIGILISTFAMVADAGHEFYSIPLNLIFEIIENIRTSFEGLYRSEVFTPSKNYLKDYFDKQIDYHQKEQSIKKKREEIMNLKIDPDGSKKAIKTKTTELELLLKSINKPSKSDERIFNSFMLIDWHRPGSISVPYNYSAFVNYFKKRRMGYTVFTPDTEIVRSAFFLFNICISNNIHHIYKPVHTSLIKSSLLFIQYIRA